jgi:hypothetical protein
MEGSMSRTIADQLLERLTRWRVHRVFGYPGAGINGVMGTFGRRAEGFDYIRVRHEEMAAFVAGAHARFTGEADRPVLLEVLSDPDVPPLGRAAPERAAAAGAPMTQAGLIQPELIRSEENAP